MSLSPRNLVVETYFTITMSVDAIRPAFIAAVDALGFARTISVHAIRTAVNVVVDAPYFIRTISVDENRTTVIVAVHFPYFTRNVSFDALRTAVIVAVDATYFTCVFQTMELCQSYTALCIYHPNATDHSSTIIQVRAMLLTTQSEQQLVVHSVDRSKKGQEQAFTVDSAVVYIPTDGQYLAQVLTSLLGCDAVSSKECNAVFFRG